MSSDLTVRDASASDLDAMTAVYVECFNAPPWNDGWSSADAGERLRGIVEARHFRGAVAESHGVLVGLLLGQKERWMGSFHFNLQEMCVLSAWQRQGIGRALLNHISGTLKREGTDKIYLITGPNTDAAAYYEALGFYSSRSRIVMASPLKV